MFFRHIWRFEPATTLNRLKIEKTTSISTSGYILFMVERDGFEPSNSVRVDLQSTAFSLFAIFPFTLRLNYCNIKIIFISSFFYILLIEKLNARIYKAKIGLSLVLLRYYFVVLL